MKTPEQLREWARLSRLGREAEWAKIREALDAVEMADYEYTTIERQSKSVAVVLFIATSLAVLYLLYLLYLLYPRG